MKSSIRKNYYKYRPIWSRFKKPDRFTRDIVLNSKLWYAQPSTFNDPYDCNLKLHINNNTDDELEFYLGELRKISPAHSHILTMDMLRDNPRVIETLGAETIRSNRYESSVLCLSNKGTSVPMFSYYAGSHTGVALEFEFSDFELPCGIPCGDPRAGTLYDNKVIFNDVIYQETMPELNYIKLYNKPEIILNTIFSKSQEWAHEKEFRIFRRDVQQGLVAFPEKMLTRIILGYRADLNEIRMVKSWLKNRKVDITLSKAREIDGSFDFHVEDIEIIKGKN